MLNLIKKDWEIGAIYLPVIIVLIPFVCLMVIWTMMDNLGFHMGIFIVLATVLILVSSFLFVGINSASQSDALFVSLPVPRYKIVIARYTSTLMLLAGVWLLVIMTCFAAVNVFAKSPEEMIFLLKPAGLAGLFLLPFLIIAVILPFFFRFDPGKGFIAFISFQIAFMLLVDILRYLQSVLKGSLHFDLFYLLSFIRDVLNWVLGLPAIIMYAFAILVPALFMFTSMVVSIFLFRTKEL
ncbi:ABC-2 transporter permease [candidate division KSB1 bacterium]|nr:ABC-2 transporter permease [candidate division KSB1 bacterium]